MSGSRTSVRTRRKRKYTAAYTGPPGYLNKFKKPRRVKKYGKFALHGIRHEREIWGINNMRNCNYTGFMSCLPKVIAYDLGVAFIRYVMRKHYQMNYRTVSDDLITASTFNTSYPIQLHIYVTSETTNSNAAPVNNKLGTFSMWDGVTSASRTVNDFAVWFRDTIVLPTTGSNDLVTTSVLRLSAYSFGLAAPGLGTSPVALTESVRYPIERMKCHVYSKVMYNVQNQTTAQADPTADGDEYATDRVDTNPIQGYMYYFRGLMPSLRQNFGGETYAALENGDLAMTDGNGAGDGVIIPSVAPSGSWRAPPRADAFNNCIKMRKFVLKPGEIKRGQLNYSYKGNVFWLVQMLQNFSTGVAPSVVNNSFNNRKFGNCVLLAMEKVLRTGSSKNIKIAWHVDRFSGARITGVGIQPMQRFYTQEPGTVDWTNNAT